MGVDFGGRIGNRKATDAEKELITTIRSPKSELAEALGHTYMYVCYCEIPYTVFETMQALDRLHVMQRERGCLDAEIAFLDVLVKAGLRDMDKDTVYISFE